MKLKSSLLISVSLLLMLGTVEAQSQATQHPILEKYYFNVGSSGKTNIGLASGEFGGGTAQSAIRFVRGPQANWLSLRVWRFVRDGDVAFALLVFKVSVRGTDSSGKIVYSKDFEAFRFGDSASGEWAQKIRSLPPTVQQVAVTFYGNYE